MIGQLVPSPVPCGKLAEARQVTKVGNLVMPYRHPHDEMTERPHVIRAERAGRNARMAYTNPLATLVGMALLSKTKTAAVELVRPALASL